MSRAKLRCPPRADLERRIDCDGYLTIRATPNAAADEIRLVDSGTTNLVNVRTTSTPEDGKANAAILALLAEALGLPRSALTLVRGASARDKRIHVSRAGQ